MCRLHVVTLPERFRTAAGRWGGVGGGPVSTEFGDANAAEALTSTRRLDPIARTSLSLAASTGVTAVVGMGFWAVAARTYPTEVVGRDSALITTVMALSAIAQLNLNNSITRFLPRIGIGVGRRILQAYALAGGLSLLTGIALVLLAPLASDELGVLSDNGWLATGVVLGLVGWSVFTLQDDVLAALDKAPWVPVANLVFAVAKLVAVVLLVSTPLSGHAVFVAWFAPTVLLIPAVNLLIAMRAVPQHVARRTGPEPVFGRQVRRFLLQDFVGGTALQVAAAATPLLVVALVGASESAYFFIAFTAITTSDLFFLAMTASLTTEAARAPDRVAELTSKTVKRLVVLQVPIVAVELAFAPLILLVFGSEFSDNSATVFRLLACASIFRTVQLLFAAVARLRGDGGRLLVSQVLSAVVLIASLLVFGLLHGLEGIAVGWLVGNAVVALVLLPYVVSFCRQPSVAPFARDSIPG